MKLPMRAPYLALSVLAVAAVSAGQEVVAPTPEKVGPVRGDDWHDYNIVNSFETGYRFLSTGGNVDTYRSTEDLGNGVRLLSSFMTVNSRNGRGPLFDEIVLSSEGLGGDPNSIVRLRVQKNHLYEYNLQWRRSEYFNPGLVTDGGAGLHLLNTAYTLQDHDLTLFPQSTVRFFLGYTRDSQTGAGISTVQLFNTGGEFDPTGNIFPLFTNVKRIQNEYRLGAEVHFLGFTLNAMHGWVDFKDDSNDAFNGASSGDNFNSNIVLNLFGRTQPYHGTSPYWRALLFRNDRLLSLNARFTYTSGARAFVDNETAIGFNRFGAATNQQILSFGNARRPITTGNVNLSLFPTSKVTVIENAALYDVRTDGNSAYLQFNNALQVANLLYFQYLRIRTVGTSTDVIYKLRSWLDIHGGYEYSNRRITSSPQLVLVGTAAVQSYSQANELNSGAFGVRMTPLKPLTVSLDGEIGHANRPFTPKADRNYSALTGRVRYKFKTLQLVAWSHSDYNENSITLSAYSSHSRSYSGSASWSPLNWFYFDASYSKIHVDTLGGIEFFAGSQLFPNQWSYYVSNLHSGIAGVRLSALKRVDLFLGYSRVQDTGDGRPISTLPAFQAAETFPLTFQSPLARISVRLSERVRWNFGYEYFGFHAPTSTTEDYLAHTGYTSFLWSF
jgi:hypothetical protein